MARGADYGKLAIAKAACAVPGSDLCACVSDLDSIVNYKLRAVTVNVTNLYN